MKYIKSSLRCFLHDTGDRTPAPGGGSAAALTVSLGIGLLLMVARYTYKHPRYTQSNPQMRKLIARLQVLSKRAHKAIDDDIAVCSQLFRTYKLPCGTGRDAKLDRALTRAQDVPFGVCVDAYDGIRIADILVKKGNKKLISDVGCAVRLLHAGFHAARLNVGVNVRSSRKCASDARRLSRLNTLSRKISTSARRVDSRVSALIGISECT